MRRVVVAVTVAVAALGLTACEDRECLEGHTEIRLQTTTTVVNGKPRTVTQPVPVYVCDRYEEKEQ